MHEFIFPILGGVLIGLSAFLLLVSIGKIAGIAGIIWGALFANNSDKGWRWLFLLGLLLGGVLFHQLSGTPIPKVDHNIGIALIAGLLVGIGVRVGNGCTSGHGVCGISRLSMRSLFATVTFMVMAILTVFLIKQIV